MRPRLRYVAFASAVVLAVGMPLLGVPGRAHADGANGGSTTLYRWVDAQGVIHFSDTPQPGAQKIQVSPAQTFPSTHVAGGGETAPPSAQQVYQACEIAQPNAEQSFYAPEVIGISVRLTPDLRPGDQLALSVDGHGISSIEGSALDFELPMPDRGAHMLQAVVRDAEGHTLCSSTSITIYVQRPSLLAPQSPADAHGSTGAPPIPRH
ncbi:MAG TPA: DUF4124 domain-containing protein [Steroidobacteraceae bacterium]|jgi:hypothetical protein|nr:DUF4124 domain-containing protein [Steroidobacteraceae bacterium]